MRECRYVCDKLVAPASQQQQQSNFDDDVMTQSSRRDGGERIGLSLSVFNRDSTRQV